MTQNNLKPINPMIKRELNKYYVNFYDIKKRKKYQKRIISMEVKEILRHQHRQTAIILTTLQKFR